MLTRRPRPSAWLRAGIPIHPLLIAAVPALFLFAENADQQVTLEPLWGPLLICVGIGAAALLVGTALLRDGQRGALLASLGLVLFFSFGHAWNLVSDGFDGRRYLVAAWVAIGVVGTILIWRGGRWVRPTNGFVTVVAAILLVVNGARIGGFAMGATTAGASDLQGPIDLEASEPLRDVYYVILDRYASDETLQQIYGYDNSAFLSELEERGFTIARQSWANYFKTAFSLVSSLSMAHLDGDALRNDGPASFTPIHQAVRGHLPVPQALKSLGYEYVHIGSVWEPTAENVDADRVVRFEVGVAFSSSLWSTTALMLLSPLGRDSADSEVIPSWEILRRHTLHNFEALEDSAERPGPTYTFAHFLVPHPPYVFDSDGSTPTGDESWERTEEEKYVAQLEWTNSRVLEALDQLMDAPAGQEPIIILQADEGPWPDGFTEDQVHFDWLNAADAEIQQKYGILNALYLPGPEGESAEVYDSMSPVNEFRVVFNAYFGADLPLLPDTVYLSPDYAHMYDFVEYDRPK
jgi:hypothetical protein